MIVLSNSLLREYVEHCNHPRPADGKLHLLGMRAVRRYPAEPGQVAISLIEPQPNCYDDLVGSFGSSLALYAGTVDPGRFYTLNPMRPQGCAHLVGIDEKGGKPYAYQRGLHRGKSPAFVQAGPVVVWRDQDRDSGQDPQEVAAPANNLGLNVHRMGTIRSDIGRWSAGCLGTMDRYWSAYWEGTALAFPQEQYTLYLLDGFAFAAWHDTERKS